MASVFTLKFRDTRPVLEAALKNPDGTAYDLTGATATSLHIILSNGTTKLTRVATVFGLATSGVLRYTWIATDWNAASAPDGDGEFTVGGLIVGPVVPLLPTQVEHRMEFEVVGPGAIRATFPNADYDTLRIITDIGQG